MPSNTQTINKKILIPIIIIITCVVIFAIIFGLSAGCVLPNWFGMCKKPSAFIPEYQMMIDVKLSLSEYQKITTDPKKKTEVTNTMRTKIARQLGFDEEAAKKRIKITMIEHFKKQSRNMIKKLHNTITLTEKYQTDKIVYFKTDILAEDSINTQNKNNQEKIIDELNKKVNDLNIKTITSDSLTENEIQNSVQNINVNKNIAKISGESPKKSSNTSTNEPMIDRQVLGKINWDAIDEYGHITIYDIDTRVTNIKYSTDGGINFTDEEIDIITDKSYNLVLPDGTYQTGQIRIILYDKYEDSLQGEIMTNNTEIIFKVNPCDNNNGDCDPNANCKPDDSALAVCTCKPGYYGSGQVCNICRLGMKCPNNGEIISCEPGTYQNSVGSTGCKQCHAGSYCEKESSYPIECPTGTYSESGSSKCKTCPLGHYCRHGFSNVCPANTYNDTTGAIGHSVCTSCPEGTYSKTTGSTGANSCLPCQPGHYCYKPMYSNVSMQVCAKGMYQGATGATKCLDCSVGTYQDSLGATRCKSCGPGKYNKKTKQTSKTSCLDCPKGHYCPDGQSIPCDAGKYNPTTGATSSSACKDCPENEQSESGAEQCSLCNSGKYEIGDGSSCASCNPGHKCNGGIQYECPVGTYQNQTGATSCIDSTAGSYIGVTGATGPAQMRECPAGTYSEAGASECTPCPAGTYSGTAGATDVLQCIACPAGKYSSETGATGSSVCVDCPATTYNDNSGAKICKICPDGEYQDTTGTTRCKQCPDDYQCFNGKKTLLHILPPGSIIIWNKKIIPTGWVLCDGQNNTPDLRGRFVLGTGKNPGSDDAGRAFPNRNVNQTGGEQYHTLTIHEMPSHNHNITIGCIGNACGLNGTGKGQIDSANTYPYKMGGYMNNTGGGGSHNNMPPFYVLTYIMKL